MFNIADYLKKFARLEGDSAFQREAISKALKDVCGIESADFEVRKDVLYLKGHPMLRSIVHTKKAALLAALKASLPQTRIMDIR